MGINEFYKVIRSFRIIDLGALCKLAIGVNLGKKSGGTQAFNYPMKVSRFFGTKPAMGTGPLLLACHGRTLLKMKPITESVNS